MLERHLRIGEALTDTELIEKTAMDGGVSMVKGDPPLKFVAINDPIKGNGSDSFWKIICKFSSESVSVVPSTIFDLHKVIFKF